jgi:transposase
MPTQHRFGQELDQNACQGPNISSAAWLGIIARRSCGVPLKELVDEFGRSVSAVNYTIQTYAHTSTPNDKPRSGRPPILSLHQKKILYRAAHAAPKIEYSKLCQVGTFVNAEGTPLKPPSCSTLYQALKQSGLTNYRCKKRPKSTRAHALKRLQSCRQYPGFQWAQRILKFLDECSVQKGAGHQQEWCFRYS